MKNPYRIATLSAGLLFLWPLPLRAQTSLCPNGQQIAFPGAEGFGRCTQGGRGGRVMEVTNLNSGGPGSLRECAESTGPRVCVFRTGGTISLGNIPIRITNPFITIAGQTAPGGGIALKDGHLSVRANDVIIRYIRIRAGSAPLFQRDINANGVEVRSNEGVPIKNIIVDHTSLSWGTDDLLQVVFGSDNVTFQWNLLAESLACETNGIADHPYCDGKGLLIGYGARNVTAHHNFFAHTYIRQPEITVGEVDFVNNVSYNNSLQASGVSPGAQTGGSNGTGVHANFVGNYYKVGPNSRSPMHYRDESIRIWNGGDLASSNSGTYLFGNIGPTRTSDNLPQYAIAWLDNGGLKQEPQRYPFPQVTTTDAFTAYNQVLSGAGATLPARDSVDQRVVNYALTGTGPNLNRAGGINYPDDVGGWPVLAAGTAPADADHDGMPDSFESQYALNGSSAADGALDKDGDGYTNLEEYLNSTNPNVSGGGTVPPPPPPPPPANAAPTVSLTAPANGATVSGAITISANASDDGGVLGVQFKVDGSLIGSEDATVPYTASLNTANLPNGSHTLSATARDAAGLSATASISVTVNNGSNVPPPSASTTTSLSASPSAAAPGTTLTVSWTAPADHSPKDWISIYKVGATNQEFGEWKYVPIGASGQLSFTAPAAGTYEFRYLPMEGYVSTARSNSVVVSDGGSPGPAPITDLNGDGTTNVADVQLAVNQALGIAECTNGNVDGNAGCSVTDVQRIVNAALGT